MKSAIFALPIATALWSACTPDSPQTDASHAPDSAAVETEPVYDRYWNDLARYLAGLDPLPDSRLDSLEKRPEAVEHRRLMQKAWAFKDSVLLKKLDAWAEKEFADVRRMRRCVYYPLGGPDFITVHTLFPNAERYVLFGLEPEGKLPDLAQIPPERMAFNLHNARKTLDDLIKLSFFVTKAMIGDLSRADFNGAVVPLLQFVVARGNTITNVRRILLDRSGRKTHLASWDSPPQTTLDSVVTGVEIAFKSAGDKKAPIQIVEYWSFDAQDLHLKNQKYLTDYLSGLKPATGYMKAGSYLLHYLTFTRARETVLHACDFLLQDDTGIGLRYFDRNVWDLKFYGKYDGPIPIFRDQYQHDLALAYRNDTSVKALDFLMGYKSPYGSTNLMIARKKTPTIQP
ncbi:MAG: hypothetical protein RMM53_05455 [Bacteroidia bacterium]|nr:hypothetical protein [Bacteroidia bacterium]MDW8333644.1 hypothetical protein [Bacteroidia bacterium]